MMDEIPQIAGAETQSLMDEVLRTGVPEMKLALGQAIDRENARPLPPKYARLLPETLLLVTLRSDAADALAAIAHELERELTDSCNRHGSLYDRSYRARLRRSEDPDAPLFSVSTYAGREIGQPSASESPPPGGPPGEAGPRLPVADPGPTASHRPGRGWEGGRWLLIVEDADGREREAFRLADPLLTIGRSSDDPALRASVSISDAPHVSRRQLAMVWEERDGKPGFRIYNLGLNAVRIPGQDIPGARLGRGPLELESVHEDHTGWIPPGIPLRIGDHGPVLRVDEIPPGSEAIPVDPDATVFE